MARKTPPKPRPALRKAPDATHHPALAGVPHGAAVTGRPPAPALVEGATADKSASGKIKPGDGKGKAKPDKAKKTGRSKAKGKAKRKRSGEAATGSQGQGGSSAFVRAGRATSDSVINRKKTKEFVSLKVRIPKPLRKEIRRRAEQSGMSVDEFVRDVMTSWLNGGRWW